MDIPILIEPEVVSLDVSASPNSLAEVAGIFKDDPGIDEWVKDMAEYRRSIDTGPENAMSPA